MLGKMNEAALKHSKESFKKLSDDMISSVKQRIPCCQSQFASISRSKSGQERQHCSIPYITAMWKNLKENLKEIQIVTSKSW